MRVSQIMSGMSDNLQEILLISYFQRFSYKHMAEILGIPIGRAKSRPHTAVSRFAKDWKESVRSIEVQ
ncbi:sigma factor-like helix-turn-helix DNA-binding protein [Planctomycetota bacterium]